MRIVKVPILTWRFQDLITAGTGKAMQCAKGLPEGAEFVRSYVNEETSIAWLVFQHESFADIPPGGHAPPLSIEWRWTQWTPNAE